jgi:hypothetical protein
MKLHPTQNTMLNNLLDGITNKKVSDKKVGELLRSKEFFEADLREDHMPDYLFKAIENLRTARYRRWRIVSVKRFVAKNPRLYG